MYEMIEHILEALTNWAILAFEFVGVLVLILAGIKGLRDYFTHNPHIRLSLAEGMALALEFKLGSEILRTVVVDQISELYFIAGIIILRASLTFLIHWEIDYEEKSEARKHEDELVKEIHDNSIPQKVLDARFKKSEDAIREKAKKKYNQNKND